MHASVITRFVDFTKPLEGDVLWPYLYVLGLVTVGYVNLALGLPWTKRDGSPANSDFVRSQWSALKAQPALAKMHYKYAANASELRLSEDAAGALLRARMQSFEATLCKYFPTWDTFPADAQLGCMSMAWACGPGFPAIFKTFTQFANARDWPNAAKCAAIRTDGNPGIVPRNAQNALCFANAATAMSRGLPVDELYWPGTVPEAQEADDALRVLAERALAEHPIDVVGQAGRNIEEEETT
ncbi:MAG TPA: hypothetical protein VGI10_14140 [Polyangiaceae bacterium]|jgi:GH24 family phage-related lysozyme (muramidase)